MDRLKNERRTRRKLSIRSKIFGTAEKPRLTIYRSNKNIFAQLIDDDKGHTLASCSTMDKDYPTKDKKSKKNPSLKDAENVGKIIAQKAIKNNISNIVFDRNGYLYHGKVKALADAARKEGLKF